MSNLKIADLNSYETEVVDVHRVYGGGTSDYQYSSLTSALDSLKQSGNGSYTKYFNDKYTGVQGTIVAKKTDNSELLSITATSQNSDPNYLYAGFFDPSILLS